MRPLDVGPEADRFVQPQRTPVLALDAEIHLAHAALAAGGDAPPDQLATQPAPRATAAAVSRFAGSATIFSFGNFGSNSRTAAGGSGKNMMPSRQTTASKVLSGNGTESAVQT